MFKNRHSILSATLLFYLIPVIAISYFNLYWLSPAQSFRIMCLGFFVASFFAIVLFMFMKRLELNLKKAASKAQEHQEANHEKKPLYADLSLEVYRLKETIELQQCEIAKLTQSQADLIKLNLSLEAENKSDHGEFQERVDHEKEVLTQEIEYKNILLEESELKVAKLEEEVSEQKLLIADLEGKVHDLNYEIKTLLHLSSVEQAIEQTPLSPHYEQIEESAHQSEQVSSLLSDENNESTVEPSPKEFKDPGEQLKRCLNIAQKMTGASYYQNMEGRQRDLSLDHFALDLRHLFDSLRSEHGNPILFYSKKENRVLFANNETKSLVGWSPEKIVQNFEDLIQEGLEEWQANLTYVSHKGGVEIPLTIKSKTGTNVKVNAVLGSIPSGLFKHDVIAILKNTQTT